MKERRRERRWFQSNRFVKIVSDDRRNAERRDQNDMHRIRSTVAEYDTYKVEERDREVVRCSINELYVFVKIVTTNFTGK